MSVATRLRIATNGYRGETTNRRISIATFGYHPLGAVIVTTWRNIKNFYLSIDQMFATTLNR